MLGAKIRVNSQMTDLCRATRCLSKIVLDSYLNFIDVLTLPSSPGLDSKLTVFYPSTFATHNPWR